MVSDEAAPPSCADVAGSDCCPAAAARRFCRAGLVAPGIGWRSPRPCSSALRMASRIDLGDCKASIAFVHPFDDRPRRVDGARPPQRAFRRRHELTVDVPVLPLTFRDTPPGVRIPFQCLETSFLSALSEVHPELEDERTVVGHRPLERGDALELSVEVGGSRTSVHAIEDGTGIPRAQKQADAASGRQIAPVPPIFRALTLFVRRLAVGAGHDPPRIHPFVQQVDGFSLARTVDAGEDDNHRKARTRQLTLRLEQLGAQRRDLRLELFL